MIDNEPGGEDHEDYQRGDLSGLIVNISGDMASVRFLEHGMMPGVRLVVRADGSLAIDPSGLPKPRQRRIEQPVSEPAPEEIADAEVVRELPAGEDDTDAYVDR